MSTGAGLALEDNLLDVENLYQQLLEEQNLTQGNRNPELESFSIAPKPGFCLKTKNENGEKAFINVCKADNLPAPKDISDQQLLQLIESDDGSDFRIPMSLGEPHAELDKSGNGCTAYDVVINPDFFEELQKRPVLMSFFLTGVMEGLEDKYNTNLDRDGKILKNKKFIGTLPEQNVRSKSKPLIREINTVEDSVQSPNKTSPLITEISSSTNSSEESNPRGPEPPYTILREPPIGHPAYMVAEIFLPKVKTAASLTLDLGEDRILLQTRANVYMLDIYLPYNMIQEECGSQFNRKTKILTITMPVAPPDIPPESTAVVKV